MSRRGEILRDHYLGALRKVGAWAGLVALMASTLVASPAFATGQLTSRSATLSTSVASATTDNIAFKFTFGTSGQTVGSLQFQVCDSPLAGACANTGSSNGSSFTSTTTVSTTVNTGTWANGSTCNSFASHSGNGAVVNCTVGAITGTPTVTVTINGFTNPSAAGEWYLRVNTWTANAAGGSNTDFGAMAVDTNSQLSESATVQESLVFAVGTGGTSCGAITGGPAITMSNSTPMGTTTTASGTGKLCANTNAQGGYLITYSGSAFAGGGTTFPTVASPTAGFTSTVGTQQFGFNLVDVAESGGSGKCDSTAGADTGSYCVASAYNYDTSAGAHQIASSEGAPSNDTVFTITFKANIDTAVKSGTYTATQTFIATGTF